MHQPDRLLMHSDIPAWKRLIICPLTTDERVSLITDIFSNRDDTEVVKLASRDETQFFVDVIDEVHPRFFISEESVR